MVPFGVQPDPIVSQQAIVTTPSDSTGENNANTLVVHQNSYGLRGSSHMLRSVSSVNESQMNEFCVRMLYWVPNLGCCTSDAAPSFEFNSDSHQQKSHFCTVLLHESAMLRMSRAVDV